jgi:hypothetical protein
VCAAISMEPPQLAHNFLCAPDHATAHAWHRLLLPNTPSDMLRPLLLTAINLHLTLSLACQNLINNKGLWAVNIAGQIQLLYYHKLLLRYHAHCAWKQLPILW